MLVAAMNPCPCGNYPDLKKCTCTPGQIQQYLSKISQPFLDRIDICMEAPRIRYEELNTQKAEETSTDIRKRVCAARQVQTKRYQGNHLSNSMLDISGLKRYCFLDNSGERLMKMAFEKLGLTVRTYHKILKVARTIADLDSSEQIQEKHLKEAISYRTMDKKYWGR